MKIKSVFQIIKDTVTEFNEDNVLRLSAALAYYAVFSIGPLLAIAVGLAGLVFGNQSVHQQIHHALQSMLGENSAKMVDSMMSARQQGKSVVTLVIGIVALLVGAAGVFGQLQDSLNTLWEVKSKPGAGIWVVVRKRFLSFAMVLGVGFLLLVSLALSAALAAFSGYIQTVIPMGNLIGHLFDFIVSFGIITLLFAMIFKYLPDVRIPWSKVWVGAIGTALLFTAGKFLLGLYLGRQSTASAYGAAGSVIVILMWVYYASVILFFGAEFTQVYAKRHGAGVRLDKYAVPLTEEERAQQGLTRSEDPRESSDRKRPPHAITHSAGSKSQSLRGAHAPGEVLRENAFEFAWLMFATGFLAGAAWKLKPFRKALKLYRKFG